MADITDAPDVAEPEDGASFEAMESMMASIDPATFLAPHAMYRALRDETPVMQLGNAVSVARRADVDEVLHDHETFSSAMEAAPLGNVRPLIPLQIDPPKHAKYRRILDPLFSPRQVAPLEADVANLVNRAVDRFIDRGEVELTTELTIPFPSEVFLVLLGLPLSDLPKFLKMKNGIIRAEGRTSTEKQAVRDAAAASIYDYFEKVLEERKAEPREDLLSRFLITEVDGARLSHTEILDICFLFLIAGLDTVSATLECMFTRLAQDDLLRARVVDDPDCIPGIVEELLRYESPVSGVARVATRDTEIGGCPVHAGDQVFAMIGSANNDERAIEDPNTVDPDRAENRHIAFGRGVHRCLGSHLARLELRVALREFHARIPDYRLAPDVKLVVSPGIRSYDRVPLVFPPGGGRFPS